MAITDYATLQTALANWLNRADLTARIPEFIALAEPDMRRQLRDKKTVAALSMVAGTPSVALPAAVKILTTIRYNTSTLMYDLIELTPTALAGVRGTTSGTPRYYANVSGTLYFDVTPDTAYVTEITYIELITPLSGTNTTNTTITNSPDIYLYGSLLQSAPYLEHDERVTLWQTAYEQAVEKENNYRERTELGASPAMRLPVVFGECP